ncbi:shikimate dehydrogenase family protein [Vibrio sp. ER1A]|uniref:shikimate dehydrogenase family protein n=1 Tax=Vibrio sp. ER1A TaxID=1517681 RepID=UPI0004DD0F91|nr:saccharopine dehydrogenase NADP-binding domain-containing protein [Vibrio sp. ER1A]KFA97410.1 shikimate dehydrogenase [Vibrio sp. ER1A]
MIQCRLIGQNIQRSQSPAFHNQLARSLNIALNYELDELTTNCAHELQQHTLDLFKGNVDSANVTYPYKEQVLIAADHIAPCAQRVSAANTLVKRNDKIVAFNTDYSGFITAFKQFRSKKPGNVVLLGCGGVGKAICFSLVDLGATQIALYDKEPSKVAELEQALSNESIDTIRLDDSNLEHYIRRADGVLNCTPVGHYSTPGCPIDSSWLEGQSWVFDAVYTPHNTEFTIAASRTSIDVLSGFELFFHQANDAFMLFTGETPTKEQLDSIKHLQLSKLD